jgi:hypothetical protein
VRVVPRSFSWLDHQLLSAGYLERLSAREQLLYFFLVLVGDAQGISYYSLSTISRHLKIAPERIKEARTALTEQSLIAFEEPLYQVLALPEAEKKESSETRSIRGGEPRPISETLKDILRRNPHG